MTQQARIRKIKAADNDLVKSLVVDVLAEHGLVGEGYAGVDPEMDDMFGSYNNNQSAFYVVEVEGIKGYEVLGVGGFAALVGDSLTAELRKMYFKPELRGLGLGHKLIQECMAGAIDSGYKGIYLETTPAMAVAQSLYKKHGFETLTERMGNTGHSGCGVFMYKEFD